MSFKQMTPDSLNIILKVDDDEIHISPFKFCEERPEKVVQDMVCSPLAHWPHIISRSTHAAGKSLSLLVVVVV